MVAPRSSVCELQTPAHFLIDIKPIFPTTTTSDQTPITLRRNSSNDFCPLSPGDMIVVSSLPESVSYFISKLYQQFSFITCITLHFNVHNNPRHLAICPNERLNIDAIDELFAAIHQDNWGSLLELPAA